MTHPGFVVATSQAEASAIAQRSPELVYASVREAQDHRKTLGAGYSIWVVQREVMA